MNPQQYFYVKNGIIIKHPEELALVLPKLDEQVFRHHVNPQKNDFSRWIELVFPENKKLAVQLRRLTSKKDMEKQLKSYFQDEDAKIDKPGKENQLEVGQNGEISGDSNVLAKELEEEYHAMKNRIRELRKAGKDTSMAGLYLQAVPSRIKLFLATKEEKDLDRVKRYLYETKEEITRIA